MSLNGRLIFSLSMFGLAMGIATVFVIPSSSEPIFWLVIFIVCAYLIAKKALGKFFLHGLLVSVLNSVWITATHIIFFDSYLPRHPDEAAMMAKMPLPDSPRLMMLITGPLIGIAFGLILGLFSFVAGKIVKRSPEVGATAS
jgi:hypothetical protein